MAVVIFISGVISFQSSAGWNVGCRGEYSVLVAVASGVAPWQPVDRTHQSESAIPAADKNAAGGDCIVTDVEASGAAVGTGDSHIDSDVSIRCVSAVGAAARTSAAVERFFEHFF